RAAEPSPERPPALVAAVERLMEKAPENRYPSIGEALKDLQAITSNPRLFTSPSTKSGRSKPAAGGPAPAPDRPEAVAKTDEPKRPSSRHLAVVGMTLAGLALGAVLGL